MNKRSIKLGCIVVAIVGCALWNSAETAFNKARTTIIWDGAVGSDVEVEVEVEASSMAPGARCIYETKAENGQFSQDVKLFPGENVVTARTESETYQVYIPFSVSTPSLRVELSCSDPYYHLIVNDWFGVGEGGVETYCAEEAGAGLYRVSVYHMVEGLEFVGYDSNGFPIWEEVEPIAALTTVRIFVNDELVSCSSNGDGKELWSVGTVVLHADDQVGGFAAEGRMLDLAEQGAVEGFSPRLFFGAGYGMHGLWGENGCEPVFLSVGEVAKFGAQGVLYQYFYGANQSVDVIENFSSSDESVGTIDKLGVFVAKAPGHTQITCPNYAGSPVDVYVLRGVEMAVDGDRDGTLNMPTDSEGQKDKTTFKIPYRFWLNTDEDVSQSGWPTWSDRDPERIPPHRPDCEDGKIQSVRDLEDFARLHLRLPEALAVLVTKGDIFLGLKWKCVVSDAPAIRLYAAVEQDGGWEYIKTKKFAKMQLEGVNKDALADRSGYSEVIKSSETCDYVFKASDIKGPNLYLIFEGIWKGKGCLVPIVMDSRGKKLAEGNEVWFDLNNVEELYMRAHSTPPRANFPLPYRQDNPPESPYAYSQTGGLLVSTQKVSYALGFDVPTAPSFIPANPTFVPAPDEENKCIVFVHGIAMSVDDVACYTASFYKRLWWEGYRGRLAVYRWSTPLIGFSEDGFFMFSDGEYNSYHSALGLKKFVEDLRQREMPGARVGLAAHSLGNACAGNALRQGLTVDSYVMLEAAMSLACYFPVPADPTKDVLKDSNVQELLDAEAATPTPNSVTDQGYRGFLANIHANIINNWVNYYNQSDFWLATGRTWLGTRVDWERWNQNFKPFDPWGPKNYEYDGSLAEGQRCQLDLLGYNLHRPVEDVCEALAFVARSRTGAVGAEPATGNPKPLNSDRAINLQEYEFDAPRPDHSGQFQRDIFLMYSRESGKVYDTPLYRLLLKDLNMEGGR